MPNWCDGDITIYGSREDLEKLVAQGQQGTREVGKDWDSEKREYKTFQTKPNNFSFENFLPTPPDLLNGEGWYDWRVANWGTKWDLDQDNSIVGEIVVSTDPSKNGEYELGLGIQTAWSPAKGVFQKISEDYPDLHIEYRYVEEGMAYFGIDYFHSGEVEEDTRKITTEDLKIAGCVVDSEGNVDWEKTDEYDLYLALDTWKEYDLETEGEKTNG
jgi:hypothetical protein